MTTVLIAVGIDAYQKYSAAFLRSIFQHEPAARVVLVDNHAPDIYPSEYPGVVVTRTDNRLSMAAACNYGAYAALKTWPRAKWLMFGNNDLLCTAPFVEQVEALQPSAVYGPVLLSGGDWGGSWLDGWLMAIPRKVWKAVGEFDEAFLGAGFEDADYCLRAQEHGYPSQVAPLPFEHLEAHSRYNTPDFWAKRRDNAERLKKYGIKVKL